MSQKTETKVNRRLDELKEILAERLRSVLENQNLSQSELARTAGLKIPYVNRILQKKANATLESIARLEVALRMALIEKPEKFEWMGSKRKPESLEINMVTKGSKTTSFQEMEQTKIPESQVE